MADNPIGALWDGIMGLSAPAKIALGVAGVGGGYLVYQHVKGGTTTAASTSQGSSLPISSGDTTGISGGGYSSNSGNPWANLAGPAGPPGPMGPAGPPGPGGLYSPPPSSGSGLSGGPGATILPIGPAQAFTIGAVNAGGVGGIYQGTGLWHKPPQPGSGGGTGVGGGGSSGRSVWHQPPQPGPRRR